jgi:hypothetical protein
MSFKKWMTGLLACSALLLGTLSVAVQSAQASTQSAKAATLPATYGLTQPTSLGASFNLPKTPPKDEHVCFVNDGTTQYADESTQGLKAAAGVLGWQFTEIQANAEQPSTYAAAIVTAAQDGCTGVEIDGVNYANYEPAMSTAISHHMIVLDSNTGDSTGPDVITAARSSQVLEEVGYVTGNAIVADIKKHHPQGKVVIQNVEIPQYQSVYAPQLLGTQLAIARGCGSRCSIYVVSADISVVLGSNPSTPFVAALQTHPNTNYIITSPLTGGGLAAAIKQAGLTVPAIVGSQALAPQIKDLQSSNPSALGWVQTPWTVIGWFMADSFARYFEHLAVTDPWKSTPKPAWYITPKNVNTYTASGEVFPTNYQSEFKTMWKVG